MEKIKGPERLVMFTDAVAAIALTLLVLPLVDVVDEAESGRLESVEAMTGNWPLLLGFLLSFVVVARFWWEHHRLFEHVRGYSRGLVRWNLGWLLAIVVLPFPTQMASVYGNERFVASFYVGTIVVISLCQSMMVLVVRRTPALAEPENPVSDGTVANSVASTGLCAAAFVLAAVVPGVGYYGLLLLLASPWIVRFRLARTIA